MTGYTRGFLYKMEELTAQANKEWRSVRQQQQEKADKKKKK